MEITMELKEKLMKAGSKEELKAMLGEKASEEETARLWYEIQKAREPGGLEKVDDDELEAVNGGYWIDSVLFGFAKAIDGNDIGCLLNYYSDQKEADDDLCPIAGPEGRWQHRYQVNLKENTAFCAVCGHVKR